MSKLLKDPIVVEHVEKSVAKAVAASAKAHAKKLKELHAAYTKDVLAPDDKVGHKHVKSFHTHVQAALKA